MADHIGGIAILDRRPSIHHLYCFGIRDTKPPTYIDIPVHPKGSARPCDPAWEYEIAGDKLIVTPSVRQLSGPNTEIFHNAGRWEVQFQACAGQPFNELMQANPEHAKHFT